MTKTIAAVSVLLSLAAVAMAEPKATKDASSKSKWETLFAGDLSDAVFPKGVWSVKDGVLSATKDECIWTKKQYENFTIDLEFKTETNSNSGVLVYCSDRADWVSNSEVKTGTQLVVISWDTPTRRVLVSTIFQFSPLVSSSPCFVIRRGRLGVAWGGLGGENGARRARRRARPRRRRGRTSAARELADPLVPHARKSRRSADATI